MDGQLRGRLRFWSTAIVRGARRRCPRCGSAPLFERWNRVLPRCPACGVRYLLNQGDPWVFLLVLDRLVFIFPPVLILYFRWLPDTTLGILAVFGLLAGGLIYTTPHRYGICVALDWLTRGAEGRDGIGYSSAPSAEGEPEPRQLERDRG